MGFHGSFLVALNRLYDTVLYKVRAGGVFGDDIHSTSGTKQGSHISPLMFGWFIEQLHDLLLSETSPDPDTMIGGMRNPDLLYADDTAFIAGISTDSDADFVRAQRYLDLLCDLCDMLGMKINVPKTKGMEFRPCRAPRTPTFPLTFRGTPIPRVDRVLYMGLWWESAKTLSQ